MSIVRLIAIVIESYSVLMTAVTHASNYISLPVTYKTWCRNTREVYNITPTHARLLTKLHAHAIMYTMQSAVFQAINKTHWRKGKKLTSFKMACCFSVSWRLEVVHSATTSSFVDVSADDVISTDYIINWQGSDVSDENVLIDVVRAVEIHMRQPITDHMCLQRDYSTVNKIVMTRYRTVSTVHLMSKPYSPSESRKIMFCLFYLERHDNWIQSFVARRQFISTSSQLCLPPKRTQSCLNISFHTCRYYNDKFQLNERCQHYAAHYLSEFDAAKSLTIIHLIVLGNAINNRTC